MKWEELTTYDRALSVMRSDALKIYPAKHRAAIVQSMMGARRFEITPRAANQIRDAVTSYPELLAENGQFAIPPFDHMWIEVDAKSLIHHDLMSPTMEEGSDRRIAYHIRDGIVTVFAETDDYMPAQTIVAYRLNSPMPMNLQQQFAEWFNVSRIGIDGFLWGHNLVQYLAEPVKRSLRDQHTLMPAPNIDKLLGGTDIVGRMVKESYYGSAGELRNILGILLMLNQPAHTRITGEVPRKRGIIRGKPTPYFGYSTIDINLDKRDVSTLITRPRQGTHASPRWHEVRGHFAHNRAAREAGHEHDWLRLDDKHWECSKGCGGRRWWRELPNGRGDARVGFVHQKRKIKTNADKTSSNTH